MSVSHEVWLNNNSGARIALLDTFIEFEYLKVLNGKGAWSVTMPEDFDVNLLQVDGRVEFWRSSDDGEGKLDFLGLIRGPITYQTGGDGISTVTFSGSDATELLERRIVAYSAGSSYAEKTDQLDDMMKAIVRENLGASATDTDRRWDSYITVDPDLAAAASKTRGFSRRNVLDILQELAETSRQAGTPLYFWMVPTSATSFEFRTKTSVWGLDRTDQSEQSFAQFGLEWGNIENPNLEEDYASEATVVYAGGKGEEAERVIVEVEDAVRTARSPFGRREVWVDARNEDTTAAVTNVANARLEKGRPRLRFDCDLLDARQTRYKKHWDFGDQVSVTYLGRQLTGPILAVHVKVDSSDRETISARLEISE